MFLQIYCCFDPIFDRNWVLVSVSYDMISEGIFQLKM